MPTYRHASPATRCRLWHSYSSSPAWDSKYHWCLSIFGQQTFTKAVTAYLSVISKGSAAFVLMTILIKVFAPMVAQWQEVLYWIIIASITLANLFALRQQNLKRLMAFSSISQAGYIMLGIISGTSQGMTSLVFYVLIYMFANLSVFTVITIVALRAHKFTLDDYNGLYNTNPKLAFLMTLALFSLAGIPPFAGFFSKFFIFAAAFEGGFHLLVFIQSSRFITI